MNFTKDNNETRANQFSIKSLVVFSIFVLSVSLLAFIANHISFPFDNSFDRPAFLFFEGLKSESRTRLIISITFFGSTFFLLPAYSILALAYLFLKKDLRIALSIALVGLSSALLLNAVKYTFQRHRPDFPLILNVPGYSFPSGHSFSAFTFCGVLIFLIWRSAIPNLYKWVSSIALFIFATFIALSRVYLHVHYASDVLAGFCLSIILLTIANWILRFKPADKA